MNPHFIVNPYLIQFFCYRWLHQFIFPAIFGSRSLISFMLSQNLQLFLFFIILFWGTISFQRIFPQILQKIQNKDLNSYSYQLLLKRGMRNQISQPLPIQYKPNLPLNNQVKFNYNKNIFPIEAQLPIQLYNHRNYANPAKEPFAKNVSSKLVYFPHKKIMDNTPMRNMNLRMHIHVPASYKRDNIYYNRAGDTSWSSSLSNKSLSLKKANIKQMRYFQKGLPYQNPFAQMQSHYQPSNLNQPIQHYHNHRSVSPPPRYFSPPNIRIQNKPKTDFMNIVNFNGVMGMPEQISTIGHPRIPHALRENKPRNEKQHMVNPQQEKEQPYASEGLNKQKSTQTVSIYHRKSPSREGFKNEDKATVYNINILAPKVLVKHVKTVNDVEVYHNEPNYISGRADPYNIYSSQDPNTMSPVNRTPIKEITSQIQIISNVPSRSLEKNEDKYYVSNKSKQSRIQPSKISSIGMNKKQWENNQDKIIANSINRQLQLHYDYFQKHDNSDRSISDYVLT